MPVQRQQPLLNAIPRFTAKPKGALLGASGNYFLYFTRKTVAFSTQYWISAEDYEDTRAGSRLGWEGEALWRAECSRACLSLYIFTAAAASSRSTLSPS